MGCNMIEKLAFSSEAFAQVELNFIVNETFLQHLQHNKIDSCFIQLLQSTVFPETHLAIFEQAH